MKLDFECRDCLYNSQLKKVNRGNVDSAKFEQFKTSIRAITDNPPDDYCAPLLARDINYAHYKIFGEIIDYSREKSLFNTALLSLEDRLYSQVISSPDPIAAGLKYAMAANYIDYARLSDLNESSIALVIDAAERATVDGATLNRFKTALKRAKTLCVLHDNCGEIVLDKILIRAILKLYPAISVTSVVRGKPVINDVTEYDAAEVGLDKFARIISNGTDVPGTYLKEVTAATLSALATSDVILSKGLGNLETLYGAGYNIFYAFCCKCKHIADKFSLPVWASAFVEECR